jgi:hypothetical protein
VSACADFTACGGCFSAYGGDQRSAALSRHSFSDGGWITSGVAPGRDFLFFYQYSFSTDPYFLGNFTYTVQLICNKYYFG